MNIEIGANYLINGVNVEALVYNQSKEVLMVKETDGNLMFILGQFNVKDSTILCKDIMSYTITDTEVLNCINSYLANCDKDSEFTAETVVKAIRNTYYQIPTYIAEVVAEWYMR